MKRNYFSMHSMYIGLGWIFLMASSFESDPAEQHDVAPDHPDIVKELTANVSNYKFN